MFRAALRRFAVAVPAAAAVLALATPAHAARASVDAVSSGCTITTHMPSRLGIDRTLPQVAVSISIAGCPAGTTTSDAEAYMYDPTGHQVGWYYFDGSKRSDIDYLDATHAGVFRMNNGDADFYDGDYNQVPATWRYSTMVAKFSTRSAMSVTRKGSTLTFGGYVKRYNPNAYGYSGYGGKTVYLQRHTSRGWVTVRTVHCAATGAVKASYPSATRASYRWMISEAPQTWAATSNSATA